MPDDCPALNESNMDLNHDEKQRLFMTLDAQTAQLEELKRGVYGDKTNGVKGLLHDVESIKTWITAANLRHAYIAGIVVAVGFALKAAWEWIVSKK